MRGMAIDPGSTQSAIIHYAADVARPTHHATLPNRELLEALRDPDYCFRLNLAWVACEWMQPRGMPTSAQEFETLFWIGRFAEALDSAQQLELERVTRLRVKQHVCGSNKANDSNIRAALIDRWGGAGGRAVAQGTKHDPGPLYGIAGDEWAALALAVTVADSWIPDAEDVARRRQQLEVVQT